MTEVNLKKLGKKQLDKYKIETREKFFSAEKELENIDKEYTRRIPFVSCADEARANDKRSQDRRICDIWRCKNDTKWRFMIRLGDSIFTLFLCAEHCKNVYEGRHSIIGSMSRAKEGW